MKPLKLGGIISFKNTSVCFYFAKSVMDNLFISYCYFLCLMKTCGKLWVASWVFFSQNSEFFFRGQIKAVIIFLFWCYSFTWGKQCAAAVVKAGGGTWLSAKGNGHFTSWVMWLRLANLIINVFSSVLVNLLLVRSLLSSANPDFLCGCDRIWSILLLKCIRNVCLRIRGC